MDTCEKVELFWTQHGNKRNRYTCQFWDPRLRDRYFGNKLNRVETIILSSKNV